MTGLEITFLVIGVLILIHLLHFLIFFFSYQPILMYHRIDDRLRPDHLRFIEHKGKRLDLDQMKTGLDHFKMQLMYLKKKGYRTVFEPTGGRKNVIITFDDGYEDNYLNAFPILRDKQFTAIFFLTTDFLNTNQLMSVDQHDALEFNRMLSFKQIQEMIDENMVIASHTKTHQWLVNLEESQLNLEIKGSQEALRNQFKTTINQFAYPAGMYDQKSLDLVKKTYQYAYVTSRGHDLSLFNKDPHQIERETISRDDSLFIFKLKLWGIHRYLRKFWIIVLLKKVISWLK